MRSVDEHLERALAAVSPLRPFDVALLDAQGCVLAEDVVAPRDVPPFDNSSMDGYAVRVEDVAGASDGQPVTLPVVGDIAAGSDEVSSVGPGLSARIMTGAPMPAGADAVVPVEWTDGGVATVEVRGAPEPGQHVRRRASDVAAGDVVLTAGTLLGPRQLGLLATLGRDRVVVHPRPRVVVLSTGSELVEPGSTPGPAQIFDSNSYALTAAARECGVDAFRVGAVTDDPTGLLSAIEDQLIRADLVLTTGGVSVGAYDVVKQVLGRLGTVDFERVAMQPGMPQGFGVIGPDRTPIFTLPGNPVSCYISFQVFVRPVLRRLAGLPAVGLPRVRAVSTGSFDSPRGKRQFFRAKLDRAAGTVTPVGGAGSHLVGGLSASDALIVVPEHWTRVEPGVEMDVLVLDPTLEELR